MTRDEIINNALVRLRDATHIVWSCDTMCNYVNAGYSRVLASSPYWPFLKVLSASTGQLITPPDHSITLPTDAYRVVSVFNATDAVVMQEIVGARSHLEQYPAPTEGPGLPIAYEVYNNVIRVYPYPTAVTQLSVEYWVRPARLAAASDVPAFPTEYHDMLVEFAMYLAYTDDGNAPLAQAHLAEFQARLVDMKHTLLAAQGDAYAQINDSVY